MIIPVEWNPVIWTNGAWEAIPRFTNPPAVPGTQGSPIDVTGWTSVFQLRDIDTNQATLVSVTGAPFAFVDDEGYPSGIDIFIPATTTASLRFAPEQLHLDFVVTIFGVPYPAARGVATIRKGGP